MTTTTEALNVLAEARRPCTSCGGTLEREICVHESRKQDYPGRVVALCDRCHGEGTVLVFRDSLWDVVPTGQWGEGELFRRRFADPLEAVGPVLRDWWNAKTGKPPFSVHIAQMDAPDDIFTELIDACRALGWLKEKDNHE